MKQSFSVDILCIAGGQGSVNIDHVQFCCRKEFFAKIIEVDSLAKRIYTHFELNTPLPWLQKHYDIDQRARKENESTGSFNGASQKMAEQS